MRVVVVVLHWMTWRMRCYLPFMMRTSSMLRMFMPSSWLSHHLKTAVAVAIAYPRQKDEEHLHHQQHSHLLPVPRLHLPQKRVVLLAEVVVVVVVVMVVVLLLQPLLLISSIA